jgi:FKBP-type peptidyl-prolyl cis-trans isomerase
MQKTPSGLEYKIFKSEAGDKIAVGNVVYFKVIGKAGDSALFNTYKNVQMPYAVMQVRPDFAKANFEEGLTLLAAGDSALIKINADSFFNKYSGVPTPQFIKKGSAIDFYIKIDSFHRESKIIEDYVKNSGQNYTKTSSGLYYVVTQETQGEKGTEGDTISANYTGKLFNGKIFDSNAESGKPFKFILGTGSVIMGWHEIFAILHEGEKATVVIPSSLAYGPRGAGPDILPYTPIVFDVELVKITKPKK